MLAGVGATILGILIFLFIFWKRLKEDYASEIIFQSATYILLGLGVGWAASARYFPTWFFWVATFGGLIGLAFAILRFKVKFYETLEAFIMGCLPWLGLVFLADSVSESSLSSFLAFMAILVMVFASYYLDVRYKGYTWYRSGRVGFAGLAVAVFIFIIRSAIAIVKVPMLSFAGGSEVILSVGAAIVSLLLLFNLAKTQK